MIVVKLTPSAIPCAILSVLPSHKVLQESDIVCYHPFVSLIIITSIHITNITFAVKYSPTVGASCRLIARDACLRVDLQHAVIAVELATAVEFYQVAGAVDVSKADPTPHHHRKE